MRTPSIDVIGRTRQWMAIGLTLVVISLLALGIRGLDFSIDFVGGNSYQLVDVDSDVTSQQLRTAAEDAGAAAVIAQIQQDDDGATGALVRTESIEPGSDVEVSVREALTEASGAQEVGFEFVGPVWGQRITVQMLQALLVFLVVITLYISFRLDFKMAIAALVALAHDLVITIGLYALVGFDVSPSTVIALLTILGYSLYDTVVVFDRVKENEVNLGEPGLRTIPELVNASTNQVVIRSINTSITSLLPVGALLFIGSQLLGASTLQDLALALFIGMAVGIFSSLFIAGPVYAWLKSREPEEQRRLAKVGTAGVEPRVAPDASPDDAGTQPAAASPEARAPITTDYVRGQGKRKRRRR